MKHLVLVVGVGRSGTSLLSGILGQLGFHIPQPEVQADDTNPRGFGEPRWVVDFHSRVLADKRVTLNDSRPAAWKQMAEAAAANHDQLREWLRGQLDLADQVVVKDPRTVWFLDEWQRCADELGARSLVRDDAPASRRDRGQRPQVLRPGADHGRPHCGVDERDAADRALDARRPARVRPL